MSLTITDWITRHRPVTSAAETLAEATPLRSRFARDEPAPDAGTPQLKAGETFGEWDFLNRDEHRE